MSREIALKRRRFYRYCLYSVPTPIFLGPKHRLQSGYHSSRETTAFLRQKAIVYKYT